MYWIPALIIFLVSFNHVPAQGNECNELLLPLNSRTAQIIEKSKMPVGILLGASSDIVLTISSGNIRMLPETISRWLPLFNEMANVMSSSTGQKWLYSGTIKKVVDGVALGAIFAHAIHEDNVEESGAVGALILAADLGLTFWFPNKYFHKIMVKTPSLLPKQLKGMAQGKFGQAVIGISMIAILEQILQRTEHLATKFPHEKERGPTEKEINEAIDIFLTASRNGFMD